MAGTAGMAKEKPQLAILGAGIFVRNQYIPRLAEISHLFNLKAIWSRTEESARRAVENASKYFPGVLCKWGVKGLDEIIHDDSIPGVAVVLAGHTQVDISLRLLKAGKHVLQEKPAAACFFGTNKTFRQTNRNSCCFCPPKKKKKKKLLSLKDVWPIDKGYGTFSLSDYNSNCAASELETALARYKAICANLSDQPIWAVAENYRFEPAFVESKKLIAEIGDMMSVQVIVEGSMNSSNPYFSSTWRRNYTGGFILDMGVHFIAGLRMLVGCEVVSVSAMTTHVDPDLPPPDNLSSLFQLENGCSGVFVMVVSSRSPQILWRVVGLKGTVQIERGHIDGQHGYLVLFFSADGQRKSSFYPFSGVDAELKTFIHDVSLAKRKKGSDYEVEPRLSFLEGARDVAILDAMLESGSKQGALVQVKKF